MAIRVRTLDFLPEIFKTPTNQQFLQATLDQLTQQSNTTRIEGYIGSKFGYGINANDKYVVEPNQTRTNYQLDPAVIFLKKDTTTAKDFLTYPGLLDAIKLQNGDVTNNNQMMENQFYSWDSFCDLDKLINFSQYYWLPTGPKAVKVGAEAVYKNVDYDVTSLTNAYTFVGDGTAIEGTNPIITLMRGGEYLFKVNQNTPFWIQGVPGVTGLDPSQPNINTRDVLGVTNNGASTGVVGFTVPYRDALTEYPGKYSIDLISSLPFEQINGAKLSTLNFQIDGVGGLQDRTMMFYGYGPGETGTIGSFFGTTQFDESDPAYSTAISTKVTATSSVGNAITCASTAGFQVGEAISFDIQDFGITTVGFNATSWSYSGTEITVNKSGHGLTVGTVIFVAGATATSNAPYGEFTVTSASANSFTFNVTDAPTGTAGGVMAITAGGINTGVNYYIKTINSGTSFTISYQPNGPAVILATASGTMVATTNEGLFEESRVTVINNTVYKINLIGEKNDPVIQLLEHDTPPTDITIVPTYGTEWGRRNFVRTSNGEFNLIPYGSAALDTLYYQDGSTPDKYGVIRIVDNNDSNYINVEKDILGKTTYISPNGVVFTNGLKIEFTGDVYPESYAAGEFYVEGVGVGIKLVPVTDMVIYEDFGRGIYGPWDIEGYDDTNYEITLDVPVMKDYITIARDSINRNAWSRSNRWFHVDVINATARYTNDETVLSVINDPNSRANRPIIEYYSDIKLFNSGTIGKAPVDFVDFTSVDALMDVAGLEAFYPNAGTDPLFSGARIIFANDTMNNNKIFVVDIEPITKGGTPVITLTEAADSPCLADTQTVIRRGENKGSSFYYTGTHWVSAQLKSLFNQYPLFDIFDNNGISFGDQTYYEGTNFAGTSLFKYSEGTGTNDAVLGFPIKYSSISNLGDISFDVSLNIDTFEYVENSKPVTQNINTGFVHRYKTRTEYDRLLGWQTAAGPSFQYQVFNLTSNLTGTYSVDIAPTPSSETPWPTVQVYVNNERLASDMFTVTSAEHSATITLLKSNIVQGTPIEILVLSEQTSSTGYYEIPSNLNNNPFNTPITTASVGDIRGHYQSIHRNYPFITGSSFGANNYRDQGNLIPYGTRIIQNSAPLWLPSTFMRNQNFNLFNSLTYNANEYVKFKSLLVDIVNKSDYNRLQTPSFMLDDALDQISSTKTESSPFFWSDMVPSRNPYITKTYTFRNVRDTSVFSLSRIYDFSSANYYSVLIYVTRKINGVSTQFQLLKDSEYIVNTNDPSITVTFALQSGDIVTVKEYNQTYGSYVPSTPSKLGMYPVFDPEIILDDTYVTPTYFMLGHDGSYTKLYGSYNNGVLEDFRDLVLFEFEKRVYNNIKVSKSAPFAIDLATIIPGQFRTTEFTVDQYQRIYSYGFLNWIGQNRIDYQSQYYAVNNPFTWNYNQSTNKLDKSRILQGNWRGIYRYLYDTEYPHTRPWEMLGISDTPEWWVGYYGEAPYTSDNTVLWNDMAAGYNWNDGKPFIVANRQRPNLLDILPVDSAGNLRSPFDIIVGNYDDLTFNNDWTVGDVGPAEDAYLKSSTWPFDLMRIMALSKPAKFFNLYIDVDNYKYSSEFNQFLVNDRSHLTPSDIVVYGNGTPKHSYVNWIVDYEKQYGVDSTKEIENILYNLDVRLVYRLAGFSDKDLLKFYVEKGTPNSKNNSLLIPDESYSVLLYENQPFDRVQYSSIIVQKTSNGYSVYGNSQNQSYFTIYTPKITSNFNTISVLGLSVRSAKEFLNTPVIVPYGTEFVTVQDLTNFITGYGAYITKQGMTFDLVENNVPVTWEQMVAETLYWIQTGWEVGSTININPAAKKIKVDRESAIVQPLTIQQQNFVLNQNLIPIQTKDMAVTRNGTEFTAIPLNEGDTVAFFAANLSNIEHAIVFDNVTLFNDVIYNLVTGLRQQRILVKGVKTAEWTGTLDAYGFILNQDNIQEWQPNVKYTKGAIVKYQNDYYISTRIVQPNPVFDKTEWTKTDYNTVQKGLLPNPSTRAYESTSYYDINHANLENDADLLGFSLIGYRPRDYLAAANLTDITQVNVYRNFIKGKGTGATLNAFNNATLAQGDIKYDIYENWAIKSSEYAGVLNTNFAELRLDKTQITGNPGIIAISNGEDVSPAVQQNIPLYNVYNYDRQISTPDILSTIPVGAPSKLPNAGFAHLDDIKIAAYNYAQLGTATIPLSDLYKNDFVWLADYLGTWQVYTPISLGLYDGTTCNGGVQVTEVVNNLNGTCTVNFNSDHGLKKNEPFAILNFNSMVDGYYTVQNVVNAKSVLIAASIDPHFPQILGSGLVVHFQSQRVSKGSEISELPLLNTEFTKTKVWVDEAADGNWAVYQKTPNYAFDSILSASSTKKFGTQVEYVPDYGYLVSDPDTGKIYTFVRDINTDSYITKEVRSYDIGAGNVMVEVNGALAISMPRTTASAPNVKMFEVMKGSTGTWLTEQSTISAPTSAYFDWGKSVAISGDTNWVYVSSPNTRSITAFVKNQDYTNTSTGQTIALSKLVPGDKMFYTTGSFPYTGERIRFSTSAGVETFIVEAVEYQDSTGLSKITISAPVTQGYDAGSLIYLARQEYTNIGSITVNGLANSDGFGNSLATNYDGTKLVIGTPNQDYSSALNNIGYTYIFDRAEQTILVNMDSGSVTLPTYNLAFTEGVIVTKNGNRLLEGVDYTMSGTGTMTMLKPVFAGDKFIVGSNVFTKIQQLQSYENISEVNSGIQFGISTDITVTGNDIIVGAPFDISDENQEGSVHRYTNEGKMYGTITGVKDVSTIFAPSMLLINGYPVTIPVGTAANIASAIATAQVPNVTAYVANNKLVISLINKDIAPVNNKLNVSAVDEGVLDQLGIVPYTKTQIIRSIHKTGATQFGYSLKFNERGSFVVGAPVSTRYVDTLFDFTDDDNINNDTVFDNNLTQWIDATVNGGSVYMYDYIHNYNESIVNPGKYAFAQSIVNIDSNVGKQPLYGRSVDFKQFTVIVGAPTNNSTGAAFIYDNPTNQPNWEIKRQSVPVVDIERIADIQLFDDRTDSTVEMLDYIDPLQGKILGAARENIDVVSPIDPAGYNNEQSAPSNNVVWGKAHVGKIWFDTSRVRFMNYHQNDVAYNSRYWGAVFPGSFVGVYSWIESDVPPAFYQGQGTPYDLNNYTTLFEIDSNHALVTRYYYWVRDTNTIFTKQGKTLPDSIIASYISNPQNSGIAYFAGIEPNVFGLYNVGESIRDTNTVLHIGFSTGNNRDVAHNEYSLIRSNYPDDFLPGLPNVNTNQTPGKLYKKMIDSLCGVDQFGSVVPDIALPSTVRYGISTRPRQSMFINRYNALKNYFTYANNVLAQYPIAEFKQASYLTTSGEFYDTTQYWEYINWWETGYSDATKSALEVPKVYDLATITPVEGMIVTVVANSDGKREVYKYTNAQWVRIGLENGTIQIKSVLWDYPSQRLGFGDNFYDATSYDIYPSEETKYIIRALNEQIYTNELLIHRNRSLILLFEYIQSESLESQNYLPWLNKTSFVDVAHTIRELYPYEKFQRDNQTFLSGYLNEVKPYHVVIKDFLFKYTGTDVYASDVTDFDVPTTYDSSLDQFIAPQLVYKNPNGSNEFLNTDPIWDSQLYYNWYSNYGLSLTGLNNYPIAQVNQYVVKSDNAIYVDNVYGLPTSGTITIDDEIMTYSNVSRELGRLEGVTRGVNNTPITDHPPGSQIYMNLNGAIVLDTGRLYQEPPKVTAYIDTSIYPAPRKPAVFLAEVSNGKVFNIIVQDPGEGYVVQPTLIIEPSYTATIDSTSVNPTSNTITVAGGSFASGDIVYYSIGSNTTHIGGLTTNTYYYISIIQEVNGIQTIAFFTSMLDAQNDENRVEITSQGTGDNHKFDIRARASAIVTSSPTRQLNTTIKFDRTSYRSKVTNWVSGDVYAGPLEQYAGSASSNVLLYESEFFVATAGSGGSGVTYNVTATTEGTNTITMTGGTNPTNNLAYQAPVVFSGTSAGGLLIDKLYYVKEIVSPTMFTVSETPAGDVVELTSTTPVMQVRVYPAVFNVYVSTMDFYAGYGIGTGTIGTSTTGTLVTGSRTAFNQQLEPGSILRTSAGATIGVVDTIVSDTVLYLTTNATVDSVDISYTFGPAGTITTSTSSSSVVGVGTQFTLLKEGMTLTTLTNRVIGVIASITSDTLLTLQDNAFIGVTNSEFSYGRGVYAISMNSSGVGYQVGDIITISGDRLNNGQTPDNDLVLAVTQIGSIGEVLAARVVSGSPNLTGITIRKVSTQGGISGLTNVDLSGDTVKVSVDFENSILKAGQVTGENVYFYQTPKYYPSLTPTSTAPGVTGTGALFDVYTPVFTATEIESVYGVSIANSGTGYDDGLGSNPASVLYIDGANVGGVTGVNDVTITVTLVGPAGEILQAKIDGVVNIVIDSYYLKAISGTEVELYNNSTLTNNVVINGPAITGTSSTGNLITCDSTAGLSLNNPINFRNFVINGPTISATAEGTNVITCSSTEGLVLYDPIVFSGTSFGGIESGKTYYIVNIYSATEMSVSIYPTGYPIPLTNAAGSLTSVSYPSKFGNLVSTKTYFVKTINSGTTFTVSETPGYSATPLLNVTGSATSRKFYFHGPSVTDTPYSTVFPDYIYLTPNLGFESSYVRYANQVYECLISNNDTVFDYSKWKLLQSSDTKLNALDRAVGYYTPTLNMPGMDLTQLYTGIQYPYNTYKGNAFDPDSQFELDTMLKDQPFHPTNIDINTVVYDGERFVAIATTPDYTATMVSTDGSSWDIKELSSQIYDSVSLSFIGSPNITATESATDTITCSSTSGMSPNDSIKFYGSQFSTIEPNKVYYVKSILDQYTFTISTEIGGSTFQLSNATGFMTSIVAGRQANQYFMTTNNLATNIMVSYDAAKWITPGVASAFDTEGFNSTPYDATTVSLDSAVYNSVALGVDRYVAVGDNILFSNDGIRWERVYTFPNTSFNQLQDATFVNSSFYSGFIAVGQKSIVGSGNTAALYSAIIRSSDGVNWTTITTSTSSMLNAIAYNKSVIVTVGDNATIKYSTNGSNWSTASILGPSITDSINSVAYGKDLFVAVGDAGTILTSANGISWDQQTSSSLTTENLNDVVWSGDVFLVVGNNNAIFTSENGIDWTLVSSVSEDASPYTVQGSPFLYGYGPEELVPGIVSDDLSMFVKSTPGNPWTITSTEEAIYKNTGFAMVSKNVVPDSNNTVSFANMISCPAHVSVFAMNTSSDLGTRLYEPADYTVDWIKQTITLTSSLSNGQQLMIEVYDIGNGSQLVKSNSLTIPIRTNSDNVSEIILDGISYFNPGSSNPPIVYCNGNKLEYNVDFTTARTDSNELKLVFNTLYDSSVDYMVFSVFNDFPVNLWYSTPETEVFEYTGSNVFPLAFYSFGQNPENAVVEVNGLRLTPGQYTIAADDLEVSSALSLGDVVACTTFNDTQYQYLNTEIYTGVTVSKIVDIDNTTPVRVTTATAHGFANNANVIIDGVEGAYQLNGQTFVVRVISSTVIDLYHSYTSAAWNTPVQGGEISTYLGGGFACIENSFPVTQPDITLTDPKKLWVTVNGSRLDNSQIRIYDGNYLGLLTAITSGQTIVVTSMVSGSTPNEEQFRIAVDKFNNQSIYRANTNTYTWLTQPIYNIDTVIYVSDVTKLVDVSEQYTTAFEAAGIVKASLVGDRRNIVQVSVFNQTRLLQVDPANFAVVLESLVPTLHFSDQVGAGDQLLITVRFGNEIIVNGEKIRFSTVDYATNSISGLIRGVGNTSQQDVHDQYSTVYSILPTNRMPDYYYTQSWNSFNYNAVLGDPLQLSTTAAAEFLKVDTN